MKDYFFLIGPFNIYLFPKEGSKKMIKYFLRKVVLINGIFLLAMALAVPQALAANNPPPQLLINNVFVDFDNNLLIINGYNFDNKDTPVVILGDEELIVTAYDDNAINADLPSDILDGDYLLSVSTGQGETDNYSYDLTIGAVGPEGPQGIASADGAQGPQGDQGPAGPQGDQGSAGPQGEQGLAGADGAQGIAGADGADGATGPEGASPWELSGVNTYYIQGNVGIGTPNNPRAALHVLGNIIADAPIKNSHLATKAYVDAAGSGGCYVSYSGSCLSGFTSQGSAGSWGYCFDDYSSDDGSSHFRPPGGGCFGGSSSHYFGTLGTAYVCCQ